ncbi:MAG: trypsin-like peptidase domain-containing protein [Polyangiales bacterium]
MNRPQAPAATEPTRAAPMMSLAPLVRRARASVVSIFVAQVELVGPQWGFMDPQERVRRGQGTGFIIGNNEVLTNNHVIDGAQAIEVQLDDGRRVAASVVGRDPRTDVALLRLKDAGETTAISLGDSDALEVGDWVVAIGNPYGLSQTVTTGIVSAKGRTGRDVPLDPAGYYSFIQTDASINPGNSGGPLLDLNGNVIGINTAVNRQAQGIGFAIPINMVKTILQQLREHGRVVRSWMGLSIRDVTESAQRSLGLPDLHGAMVMDVHPQGPAAAAGLRPGDVIRSFSGRAINSSSDLAWQASTAGVGHTVQLRVRRAAQELDLSMVLSAMPEPE